jgi:dTDP-4-amino-4,6-dideoxygalactose transaminase
MSDGTDGLFGGHIPLLRPWLGEEEVQAVAEVIRSGWISQGPRVAEFEDAVARYVGVRRAVATNSATSALHLSLRLSGVGAGHKVICPSFTCMATANAIHMAGAEPVFADINPRTFNLDPAAVEAAVTADTRAILVVHQIGLPADMDALGAVAGRRGLTVIEDAATALSAMHRGRRLGSLGPPTAFSFHPRKMITTGEGGMITTNDAGLAERARQLRSAGASISDLVRHKAKGVLVQQYFDHGYNYRMTDMQAAIGLVQLRKLDAMVEQRAAQAKAYDAAFAAMDEIEPPFVPEYATHAYTSYLIRLRTGAPLSRDECLREMADQGISCRVGIQPLHLEPFYRERFGRLGLPATEEAACNTMFLPIFPGLAEEEQNRVVATLRTILARHRARHTG